MRIVVVALCGAIFGTLASPAFADDPPADPSAAPPAEPSAPAVAASAPAHAPKFSLWVGPRISYGGFAFDFYRNPDGNKETTGNLVGGGVSPEIDLGVRLFFHYTPYLFYEHGFMAPGHRFDGEADASASTDYYGVGFRYLSNRGELASFVADVAVGRRVLTLKNNGQTYTMSGFELLRLGIGAEFRMSDFLTLEPLLGFSGGKLTSTSGNVMFAPGSGDKLTSPPFKDGQGIDDARAYVMISLGVGGHFDLFGK